MTRALRRGLALLLVVVSALTLGAPDVAFAQAPSPSSTPAPPKAAPQGVAVLASGATRDDAFALARAVYASALRPRGLDELRARILAGDPPPPGATKELRELAELRAAIAPTAATSEVDAASRRLLASIAQQLDVVALLVVGRSGPSVEGAATGGAARPEADAGAGADAGGAGASEVRERAVARLFLADSGELDAARYEPDTAGPRAWGGTVASLLARFPPPAAAPTAERRGPPPRLPSEGKESRPFYASAWFWGALGAAALIGGFFYFASRDTGDSPIHLQMRVPR